MPDETLPAPDQPSRFEPVGAVAQRSLEEISDKRRADTAQAAAEMAPAVAQDARTAELGEFLIDALTADADAEAQLGPFVEDGTFPDQTAAILAAFEAEQQDQRPGFDVTTLPVKALAGLIRRRLVRQDDEGAVKEKMEEERAAIAETRRVEARAGELEAADRRYAEWITGFEGDFVAAVAAAESLPAAGDPVLEAEKVKLLRFQRILAISQRVSPIDHALIAERMRSLPCEGGVPSPVAFIQTAIFSTPEQPSGVSEVTQAAIATEFDLSPRAIRTGSDFEDAMATTTSGPDGTEVPVFTESAPLRFRPGLDGFTSPDGQRVFMRASTRHGDSWPVDVTGWGANDKTRVAELLQLWVMTEDAGETGYLISLTQLDFSLSSRIDPLRLREAAQIVDATFGGGEGHDGDIFYGGDELGMVLWQAQLRSPRGSAVHGDHDAGQTDDALRALHIRDDRGTLDLDVLRAFGAFSRDHWFAAPDFEAARAYLAERFPERFQ